MIVTFYLFYYTPNSYFNFYLYHQVRYQYSLAFYNPD